MDLTTSSKLSFSSPETKTPNKLLPSNHVKASVKKKKKEFVDRLSVLCILNEHKASNE